VLGDIDGGDAVMAQLQADLRVRDELPAGLITDAMIDAYWDVGAVVVRGLLAPHWIESIRAEMDALLSDAYQPGGPDRTDKLSNMDMLLKNDAFRRLVFDSPAAAAGAALMRSKTARYYEDVLIYVKPGAESFHDWHQDTPTWPFSGSQFLNVWFSLEDVTSETGALRVIAASHHGPQYHPIHMAGREAEAAHDRHMWTGGPFPDVDADPGRFAQVVLEAKSGDVVMFHPGCIHSGYGVPTAGPRRTFTFRLLGDDVRWRPKRSIYTPWVRELPFAEGDVPVHPRFPLLWPR
jgi:ectoine hydroxylase-related dioxygenase (phytanoyl-CoA dioxygenase family)